MLTGLLLAAVRWQRRGIYTCTASKCCQDLQRPDLHDMYTASQNALLLLLKHRLTILMVFGMPVVQPSTCTNPVKDIIHMQAQSSQNLHSKGTTGWAHTCPVGTHAQPATMMLCVQMPRQTALWQKAAQQVSQWISQQELAESTLKNQQS